MRQPCMSCRAYLPRTPPLALRSPQIGLWVFCSVSGTEGQQQLGKELSGCFLAFVSAAAAFAFLLYGGRLWLMLRRFPIESRGRRKKLREVGLVTTICATCFLFRWAASRGRGLGMWRAGRERCIHSPQPARRGALLGAWHSMAAAAALV